MDQIGGKTMRRRLLIVEDDDLTAELNRRLVARLGFEVCGVAASADEALRLADLKRPDFVLMDIGLAGSGDGIEAACEIRRRLGIPSVFLTNETGWEVRSRAARAAPLGYLTKPLVDTQLLDCLDLAPGPGSWWPNSSSPLQRAAQGSEATGRPRGLPHTGQSLRLKPIA